MWSTDHLNNGNKVALKEMFGVYDSWEKCCELTEVKALQVLNHPNIVTLKEVVMVKDHKKLQLAYELLDRDLYKLIEEKRDRK